MLLAIDAGNTNIVFAVFDGDELRGSWRISTDARRTADEYAVWLVQLMTMSGVALAQIEDIMISSVVPEAMFALTSLCKRYFHKAPQIVGDPGVDLGIEVLIDNPVEVGADRLVNSIAAKDRYLAPLIVVDFGTATTFDVVDVSGNYCGGAIAPGINLSLQALHMAAAKLPRVAVRKPGSVIAKSTVTAIQSGIFWGYVGLIEGLVTRMRTEFGEPMRVVATGGLASLFAGASEIFDHVDPDLTLWGLRLIHRRSQDS
jgi:type III pantothenate kinase